MGEALVGTTQLGRRTDAEEEPVSPHLVDGASDA